MCLQLVNELTSNEKSPSSFLWFAPLTIKITTILDPVLCDVTKALKLTQGERQPQQGVAGTCFYGILM